MKLDVVIPIYNEEENINKFFSEITSVLTNINYKLIFVNDGSTDNSLHILKDLYSKNKDNVRIISFSRNFGKEAAMYAGLKYSNSEYTSIIDADLQQDPKHLLSMIDILDKNKDIDSVCMIQSEKRNRFFQNCFYKLINLMSKIKFVNGASDFRTFRRNVVNNIVLLGEKNRFSKGIFSWIGFNTKYVPYKANKRYKGKSKWNFFKLINYSVDGFVNFSTSPLKIATYSGILSSISAFIYLLVIIIKTLILGKDTPGYASLICVILFLGGIQLLSIGILGEYLAKTYTETKNRPIFIEKEKIGFDNEIL